MMRTHLERWMVSVCTTDDEPFDVMWDYTSEINAVLAAIPVMEQLIRATGFPEHDVYLTVQSNQEGLELYGVDRGADDYRVVLSCDYTDALAMKREHERAMDMLEDGGYQIPSRFLEVSVDEFAMDYAFVAESSGRRTPTILFEQVDAEGFSKRCVAFTAGDLRSLEQFISSMWQGLEMLGRLEAKLDEPEPF